MELCRQCPMLAITTNVECSGGLQTDVGVNVDPSRVLEVADVVTGTNDDGWLGYGLCRVSRISYAAMHCKRHDLPLITQNFASCIQYPRACE